MNAKELRKYWCYKFSQRFNKPYSSDNFVLELRLLGLLSSKYEIDVILEAIDRFLKLVSENKASIRYFYVVFNDKFKNIIKLAPILKYQRKLQLFPVNIQDKIKNLIDEYKDLLQAEILSDDEKIRKNQIDNELRRLTKDVIF